MSWSSGLASEGFVGTVVVVYDGGRVLTVSDTDTPEELDELDELGKIDISCSLVNDDMAWDVQILPQWQKSKVRIECRGVRLIYMY